MRETSDPMPVVREIVLAGDIDVENTPRIRRRIAAVFGVANDGCAVVVDCRAVTLSSRVGWG